MPEIKGNRRCPVRSFEMYTSLLNGRCNALWQRPLAKQNAEGDCYYHQAVGHNTLGSFMSKLSIKTELSQKYTNHDIRVTGCTILFRCQFTNKEIMAITGHKSVNSLAIYQKVSFQQKLRMGNTLNFALTNPDKLKSYYPQLPNAQSNLDYQLNEEQARQLMAIMSTDDKEDHAPVTAPIQARPVQEHVQPTAAIMPPPPPQLANEANKENNNKQVVPRPQVNEAVGNEDVPNFDIMSFLSDLDDDTFDQVTNPPNPVKTVALTQQNTVVNNPSNTPTMPVFNNCKIEDININIVKK